MNCAKLLAQLTWVHVEGSAYCTADVIAQVMALFSHTLRCYRGPDVQRCLPENAPLAICWPYASEKRSTEGFNSVSSSRNSIHIHADRSRGPK